jgi:hypothetical protein
MKSLLRKDVEKFIVISLCIIAAVFICLALKLNPVIITLIACGTLLIYCLYIQNSESVYFSLPLEVKKYIKENDLGKITSISDIDIKKEYYSTCEYDVAQDCYITKIINTSKNKKIRLIESYKESSYSDRYSCNFELI